MLDIVMPLHTEAQKLAEVAIQSQMRYLCAVLQGSRVVEASVPFEPVLAIAAMRAMDESEEFRPMFTKLSTRLLGGGLVDRGEEGELLARLLLRLAQLSARRERKTRGEAEPNREVMEESGVARDEISDHCITLQELIDALMGDLSWDQGCQSDFRQSTIGRGWINLIGFMRSSGDLQQLSQDDLLALWLKGAALQGSQNQYLWDLIIPVYCGSLDNWGLNRFSVVVVQVKYRVGGDTRKPETTVAPALPGSMSEDEEGPNGRGEADEPRAKSEEPYFVLFMDLGSTSSYFTKRGPRAVFKYVHPTPELQPIPTESETRSRKRLENLEHPRYLLMVRGCTGVYGVIESVGDSYLNKVVIAVYVSMICCGPSPPAFGCKRPRQRRLLRIGTQQNEHSLCWCVGRRSALGQSPGGRVERNARS